MTPLWDYVHGPIRNEMQAWAKREKLGSRERAQLNQKLDMLSRIGFEMARSLNCLAGTSGDHNHIFKLIVHSERMLRPMLCRGPVEPTVEATLLCGAIEKDFKLDPSNASEQAEKNRQAVISGAREGKEVRVSHERF